ncbi:LysE family translocator [Maritimibacter sp. DP1N21-5]|uniref:LysE family translocator n=1 Tax=Maritimibacter sp. DP1N21-5 TaxID=2836867 RepID=UPI001C4887F7|nr:LysE family translocator [Maritimibacter sp. DP1N21-5]MBV7407736.1 LysE family translocator [Maritimibacter sp. DP1N21-5]
MTLSPGDLGLYAFALLVLFLTPGPVWMALLARALSGGFHAAWPLALGVTIGDALWPLLAILGMSWVATEFESLTTVLKFVASGFFLWLGVAIIRNADKQIAADSRLTRPGMWAGFVAGVVVILANPKAILFYMGMLPGFFDLTALTPWDVGAIVGLSMAVPLFGNVLLAGFIGKLRGLLSSPKALKRLNISAGALLIAVAAIIPFT